MEFGTVNIHRSFALGEMDEREAMEKLVRGLARIRVQLMMILSASI